MKLTIFKDLREPKRLNKISQITPTDCIFLSKDLESAADYINRLHPQLDDFADGSRNKRQRRERNTHRVSATIDLSYCWFFFP